VSSGSHHVGEHGGSAQEDLQLHVSIFNVCIKVGITHAECGVPCGRIHGSDGPVPVVCDVDQVSDRVVGETYGFPETCMGCRSCFIRMSLTVKHLIKGTFSRMYPDKNPKLTFPVLSHLWVVAPTEEGAGGCRWQVRVADPQGVVGDVREDPGDSRRSPRSP